MYNDAVKSHELRSRKYRGAFEMIGFNVIDGAPLPIKAWTQGVQVEDAAVDQLRNVAGLPFIFRHVAAMPDVHWGMGATVGSVIATKGAIVPAAVGVDIGCGMVAARLALTASQLPDNLGAVRTAIETAVPHGRTDNGGINDRGAWGDPPADVLWHFGEEGGNSLSAKLIGIVDKHSWLARAAKRANCHLGTLGTGNHFIEICLDESGAVWVMLHSGSRGIGNAIGSYFIGRAKQQMERYFISLPDKDLAYLPEGTDDFKDYLAAVGWAQDFAKMNRQIMLTRTMKAVADALGREDLVMTEGAVNCHHNYVARENHFGQNVLVTRKGAVRAREGDLGIIPGSMGVQSYIVRGKGNSESFMSCSHGAGRAMSRTAAKKMFSLADHAAATEGVECRKDADVLDETPGAYKPINAVMAAQTDLVEIVHTLKQVVCVKG
jgi:tRNA-splicing ligase RtcB